MPKTKISNKDAQTEIERLLGIFDGNQEAAITALRQYTKTDIKKKKSPINLGDVVVELSDIVKEYKVGKQKVPALKGVSLQIKQGEFVAITGSSGSGKSTMLQLIGGLDKPTSGNVVVDGHIISKLSDRKLSDFRNKTVGFVFQFFYLQPFLKLQTNLEVPAMFARKKRIERSDRSAMLAEKVDLMDRINHLPKELSGGQMQRAAIARALQNQPKILLADEPTGNLDSVNGLSIIDLFEQVRTEFGTTVVVVTHDPKVARHADRIIRMMDGEIII